MAPVKPKHTKEKKQDNNTNHKNMPIRVYGDLKKGRNSVQVIKDTQNNHIVFNGHGQKKIQQGCAFCVFLFRFIVRYTCSIWYTRI